MKSLMLILALAATGQAAAAPVGGATTDSASYVQSVLDFVQKGGLMMIPIGLCSLITLTVLTERLISLRRRNVIPRDFLNGLTAAFGERYDDRDKALSYCQQNASPVAEVVAAGIKRLDDSPERFEKHVQEAAEREVLKMRKFTRLLSVIASIAPLMGLLGTMFGMIRAFETVATSAGALGRTELLAQGIYEALITTAAGLLVAIPALLGYHWISAKVERLVADIDQTTVEFFEAKASPSRATVAAPAPVVDAGEVETVPVAAAAGAT